MLYVLFIIPVLAALSALLMYRLTGRRELLKFDFTQFMYAFVYAPVFVVWGKSFLYLVLSQEESVKLSQSQIFIVDTVFTVFLLYVFAFVVIKSLTKSFDLKRHQDPLYDIHELSEYFHNFFSHVVMFSGALIAFSFVSVANALLPLSFELSRMEMYGVGVLGILMGILFNTSVLLYEADQHERLTRIMRLHYLFLFLLHVILYFLLDVPFASAHAAFWLVFLALTAAAAGSTFEKSEAAQRLVDKFYPRFGRHLDKK